MSRLAVNEITEKLQQVPQWKLEDNVIYRDFSFRDFREAMAFVNRVADAAESAGHHPDIDIRWNKVRLVLVSHDAGGLTERDFDLASAIDGLS